MKSKLKGFGDASRWKDRASSNCSTDFRRGRLGVGQGQSPAAAGTFEKALGRQLDADVWPGLHATNFGIIRDKTGFVLVDPSLKPTRKICVCPFQR